MDVVVPIYNYWKPYTLKNIILKNRNVSNNRDIIIMILQALELPRNLL